jgi:hypothetical protein
LQRGQRQHRELLSCRHDGLSKSAFPDGYA